MEQCAICSLDRATVTSINYEYQNGITAVAIGLKYSLDIEQVEQHCLNCLGTSKKPTSTDKYKALLEDVENALQISKTAMMDKPNSPGLQQSYAKFIETYKELLRDSSGQKAPEDTVKDLISSVINPLLHATIHNITKELDLLKSDLSKQGLSSKKVDPVVVDTFERLGKGFKDILIEALKNLNSYFGVKVGEDEIVAQEDSSETTHLN